MKIDSENGVEFERNSDGDVTLVRLINPENGEALDLSPRKVILSAGAGNALLLEQLNISSIETQQRPLHMVMVRGDLPVLNGHCVDGTNTRVTITTTTDAGGRTIWQVGGQIAEIGVDKRPGELITHARDEIAAVLPGIDLEDTEWSTYRASRAEPAMGGRRPDDVVLQRVGNIIACWPTKLALAPRMAMVVLAEISSGEGASAPSSARYNDVNWPRPDVALPPWETASTWSNAD
jgi:hypothetical protein